MNNIRKCLFCYQKLENQQIDFHPTCSKKMFGVSKPPLIDINKEQLEELAKQILVKSIAITGVQPKLSIQLEKNKNEPDRLTLVGFHGDYILKPASTDYRDLPQNEDLTMHLAEVSNIKTAIHSLIRLQSGELAYLTKRFDRKKNEKIAVEDFCQLSETLTENKYRGSIEKIGKLINQFTTNSGYEAQRLFELVLFCYLTGNADMHLKNFALIENEFNGNELSPAYDLLSTELVIENDNEESALTINGKRNRLKLKDFDSLSTSLKIDEKAKKKIYEKFERILPLWISWVEESFLSREFKEKYKEIIIRKNSGLFS